MKKIRWMLFFIVIIGLSIGGKIYMNSTNLKKEMIAVVKSDEAIQVFEEGLKTLDSTALTSDGIIKSYEIDYDSIERNPMGGIMFTAYINDDKDLYINDSLNKYDDFDIEGGTSALSSKLSKLLKESRTDDSSIQ